jgi:aspartyl-tRNA(Asn)/glutamyl-tRNA(Gln) amidotransferase subunit A
MEKLYYKTIAELAPLLKEKKISPVELTTQVLTRIQQHDSTLKSYITVLYDEALSHALQAENEILRGNYLGPLHGIPFAFKDLFYTKGVRTTSGSLLHSNFVPDYNATVVDKLLNQGIILTGKLNMHEFAFGSTNENPHYGNTKNPWNTEHITAGSSGGGGGAVAAGLCIATLGSDTGGSIRDPASFCGVVGLKPTYGRVSKYGVTPLAWSLDHVGPITRSVTDASILLEAISGFDKKDPSSVKKPKKAYTSMLTGDITGLKIGIPKNYFFDDIDQEVESEIRTALIKLESLGAELFEVEIPHLELSLYAQFVTVGAEAAAYHQVNLNDHYELYGEDVRKLLVTGELFSAIQYVQAQQARRTIYDSFKKIFKKADVIIGPTAPFTASKSSQYEVVINGKKRNVVKELIKLAAPCNLTGLPSISIPVSLASNGLPIGMQIMGKAFEEETLLNVAFSYEQVSLMKDKYPLLK